MPREKLLAEAMRVGLNAAHNLRWMQMYPERFDLDKQKDMEMYLNRLIQVVYVEMENARRPGRTSIRTRARELLFSILPKRKRLSKGEDSIGQANLDARVTVGTAQS